MSARLPLSSLRDRARARKGAAGPLVVALLAIIGAGILVANFCFFTVNEWEQALVFQFGEVIGEPRTEAGLYFKMPYQNVEKFDRRLLRWDGNPTTAITRDRRTVNIDVTARWRISDARRFRESTRSVREADVRLNGIIEGAVRDEIARFDLFEVVRSSNRILRADEEITIASDAAQAADLDADALRTLGADLPRLSTDDAGNYRAGRPIVLQNILAEVRRRLAQIDLGIEVEDILVKQLSYIREIEANVFAQMNAELQKIAAGFRSVGRQRAEERLGEMERELAIIESSALERSQRIRGQAEAESTRIFAEAFNADPEFFLFLRRLDALEKVLVGNTRLVLGTDTPIYGLLKSTGETSAVPPAEAP
jgi:membrane protease subunit HflC